MALPDWYSQALRGAEEIGALGRFFVVGCQKSGTTWVQVLCNAHPEVACNGEGHFTDLLSPMIMQACKTFNEQEKATKKLPPEDILSALRLLIDGRMRAYLPPDPPARARVRVLGDKTPEASVGLMLLDRLFPGARFVHVLRDGRDCIVSGWAHLAREGNAGKFPTLEAYASYFTERHWTPYIAMARAAGAQLGGRYMEVRYEDLLAEPLRWGQRLFAFLGVDAGEAAVASCVERSSFERLSGGRARGEADSASHFRKGIAGDWRGALDAGAVGAFERLGGQLARELGYEVGPQPAAR